jgi:putative flippase GtrA
MLAVRPVGAGFSVGFAPKVAAWASASTLDRRMRRSGRVREGLRRRGNWLQLVKFGVVGASGYAINLAVFGALLTAAHFHFRLAAVGAFLVAVTNNYTWNRLWTFRQQRGHLGHQGLRFLVVSTAVLGANIGLLSLLVLAGLQEVPAQAAAVVLVMPVNFVGNKLWSFRT